MGPAALDTRETATSTDRAQAHAAIMRVDHARHAANTGWPERVMELVRRRRSAWAIAAVGLAVFVVLGLFAVFSESTLLRFDLQSQQWIMEIRRPWLNTLMVAFTFLGTRWIIGGGAIALAIWSWATGRSRLLVTCIAVAVAINPLVEFTAKEIVARPRPDLDQLLPGRGFSFPSGHVFASVGFYGMLPFIVWESTRRTWLRTATLVGAAFMGVGMAFSRVYLDVHWTVDATAGLILGLVLVICTYRTYRWLDSRRDRGNETVPLPATPRTMGSISGAPALRRAA